MIRFYQQSPEKNIKVFYSTPSQYIQNIIHKNIALRPKLDDFVPLANRPHI